MTTLKQSGQFRYFVVLQCAALLFAMIGCSQPTSYVEGPPLEQRAVEFGDLLMHLAEMEEDAAIVALEGFIEPTPDQASRVAQYYAEFSAKSGLFTITSQSVKSIVVSADGNSAEVTYRMIAESFEGKSIPATQNTLWRRLRGNWYRTTEEPGKALGR